MRQGYFMICLAAATLMGFVFLCGCGNQAGSSDEILIGEGLRWRTQETWFGDRVDPDFGQKRGSSPGCIPSRRQKV